MTPVNNFRDDINGLRAWAVVSVILFHFGIPGFEGGFVGVDIFFVISGFLMTGIIIRGLERQSADNAQPFSLINFYISRARRIIPALLALCLALLIAGWFFLPEAEYKQLGIHSTSALSFLSNIKFWAEAGYFDVDSHEKWLLHTWSLSVEWQFYILLPIVISLIWKLAPGRNIAGMVLSGLLIVSLFLSATVSNSNPSTAFYMLHTRAWEMLAGSIVFIFGAKFQLKATAKHIAYFVGFLLISFSIYFFDSFSVWPGVNALIPVVGTILVLLASNKNGLLSGSKIFQKLGDWSYSLYLWHWPFAVGLVYLNLQNEIIWVLISILFTLALSWLSYTYVETPARSFSAHYSLPVATSAAAILVALVAIPGVAIYSANGVPGRIPDKISAVFDEANNRNPRQRECHIDSGIDVPQCKYGGDRLGVIVLGDSHAGSVIRAVEESLPSEDLHVLDWTMSGCQTIKGLKKVRDSSFQCGEFIDKAIQMSLEIPSNVPMIVVNRLSGLVSDPGLEKIATERYITNPYRFKDESFVSEMKEAYLKTICEFAKHRQVYVMHPTPEFNVHVPKTTGRMMQMGYKPEVSVSLKDHLSYHQAYIDTISSAVADCGVIPLDPLPYLCEGQACKGTRDGLPIYLDDNHLSLRGAKLLIPIFSSALDEY